MKRKHKDKCKGDHVFTYAKRTFLNGMWVTDWVRCSRCGKLQR